MWRNELIVTSNNNQTDEIAEIETIVGQVNLQKVAIPIIGLNFIVDTLDLHTEASNDLFML